MKKGILIAFFVCAACSLFSEQALAGEKVEIKFVNKSKWTINELYFSPTKQNHWGDDQLDEDVIEPGQTFALRKIPIGKYDVKIVDEDGDECIVAEVQVAESEKVEITDSDLLGCQAATEEEDGDEGDK